MSWRGNPITWVKISERTPNFAKVRSTGVRLWGERYVYVEFGARRMPRIDGDVGLDRRGAQVQRSQFLCGGQSLAGQR